MSGNFHYPRKQMAVPKHCKKCRRTTDHRIKADRTVGDCLRCLYAVDPRILSSDELTVLGISTTQLQRDIWAKALDREKAHALAHAQQELFA